MTAFKLGTSRHGQYWSNRSRIGSNGRPIPIGGPLSRAEKAANKAAKRTRRAEKLRVKVAARVRQAALSVCYNPHDCPLCQFSPELYFNLPV